MGVHQIVAHKITKPIQLLGVWFVALVGVEGGLLWGASAITTPTWIPAMLCVAAVVAILGFAGAAFLMQTRYRPQLQDDRYFAKWLERNEQAFRNFQPENQQRQTKASGADHKGTYDQYECRRVGMYQAQKGLFIVHTWRPSHTPGQIADIVIWLHQHREGPLSDGAVNKVEYHLGPMFFDRVVTKYNREEAFKLEVSAYGPMLCLARAFIRGESSPIELSRYIDFMEGPEL